ncbi:MAG: hypothetical protein IKT65_05290 [Clostridia bacterium]|nr:hypothetical protein [Clostridia bacterium]
MQLKADRLTNAENDSNVKRSTAKLRMLSYEEYDRNSTQEKINYAYNRLEHSAAVRLSRAFFSFTRKYRIFSSVIAYASVVFAAVQTGTAFVFSSAFLIISAPVVLLFSLFFAVPLHIRSKRYADLIERSVSSVYIFVADGITLRQLQDSYAYMFIKDTSRHSVCLVTFRSLKERFFGVKQIDDGIYLCSKGFINFYKRRSKHADVEGTILI